MKKIACIFLLLNLLISCEQQRLWFDKGIIPPVPVNFYDVNSAYDDFNSDLDITWNTKYFTLIFSTNRASGGQHFDLTGFEGRIESDLLTGEFEITAESRRYDILQTINTPYNELGPYFTHELTYPEIWKKGTEAKRFFYSSDISGNGNIYCCYYTNYFEVTGGKVPLTRINTESEEGYFSIHDGETGNKETAYFMSDRNGNYDIFRVVGEQNMLIDQSLSVTTGRVDELNTSADDKCPYICGNIMVFTSDRDGGFGGFDLYYSVHNGQEWSAPVNFGDEINSEFDEYRPVLVSTEKEGFLNDLMIFSSNRPGGRGLFDLYYVGIKRLN